MALGKCSLFRLLSLYFASRLIPEMHQLGGCVQTFWINNSQFSPLAALEKTPVQYSVFLCAYFLNHVFSTGDYLLVLAARWLCLHQQNSRSLPSNVHQLGIMRRGNLVNAIAKCFHSGRRVWLLACRTAGNSVWTIAFAVHYTSTLGASSANSTDTRSWDGTTNKFVSIVTANAIVFEFPKFDLPPPIALYFRQDLRDARPLFAQSS